MYQTRHYNLGNEKFFKDNQTLQDKLRKLSLKNRSALSHFKVFLNMPPSMRDRGEVCMTEIKAPNGETFSHIWIELGNKVIDQTTSQRIFDRASYYAMVGLKNKDVIRYDHKAAEIFVKRNLLVENISKRPF